MKVKCFRTYVLLLVLLAFSGYLKAQEEDVLYTFSEDEIRSLNANTLGDLVHFLPFVTSYYDDAQINGHLGVQDMLISAVYRDDIPLFMDQNTGVNLQLVGLEQVERVEFRSPTVDAYAKNLSAFNVYLYSKPIDKRAHTYGVELGNSSNNDFLSRLRYSTSNKQHSLGLGVSRYFENGVKLNPANRKFDWASFTQYNASIRYKYQFFNKASITVNYRLALFDQTNRSNIFEGTSRANDQINFTSYNWLNTTIKTKLSKTHSLSIHGQYSLNNRYRYIKEKDLSNDRTELLPVQNRNDSIRFAFTTIRAIFEKQDTAVNYGYAFGIEFTNLQDRNYESIEAIKIGYTDYTLFASTFYKPVDQLKVELGVNYLTNSLMGNYVLPRGRIKLSVNPNFSLRVKHIQTLVYPQIYQQFYGINEANNFIENNLQLQAGLLRITNLQLSVHYDEIQVRSGMNFTNLSSAVSHNHNLQTWSSSRANRDIATYLNIEYNGRSFKFSPVLAIQGLNSIRDTVDQFYFMPELTFKASYYFSSIDFGFQVFGKFSGIKNIMDTEEDRVVVNEFAAYRLLNFSMVKDFIDGKLSIRAGFSNVFNTLQLSRNRYQVSAFDQVLIEEDPVMIGRGRDYFIRISLDI